MKNLFAFLLLSQLFISCVSDRIGGGGWPSRTRDAQLLVKGEKSSLSAADITAIHEFVWSKNPNLRIIGIQVKSGKTVLVTCTDQPGDRFTKMLGFDLLRSGDGWVEGNYKSKLKVY
jgi:hypothetical protein